MTESVDREGMTGERKEKSNSSKVYEKANKLLDEYGVDSLTVPDFKGRTFFLRTTPAVPVEIDGRLSRFKLEKTHFENSVQLLLKIFSPENDEGISFEIGREEIGFSGMKVGEDGAKSLLKNLGKMGDELSELSEKLSFMSTKKAS